MPGLIPPAFSRSAFSASDLNGPPQAAHARACGRHDRHGDELPVAGGAVCDFQSRAESTGFQPVVFKSKTVRVMSSL